MLVAAHQDHCRLRLDAMPAGLQQVNATLSVGAAQHKQDDFVLFSPLKLTMASLRPGDQYSCG